MRKKLHLIPGMRAPGRRADGLGTAEDGTNDVSTTDGSTETSAGRRRPTSARSIWFFAAILSAGLAAGLAIDPLIFIFITLAVLFVVLVRAGGLAVSIQEHRRVLARLRSTEALYRSLVETNPTVTYVDMLEPGSEAGYRTRYMSPQIEGWVGYPAQAFVDDPTLWLRLVHSDDRDEVEAAHERHYATGEPLLLEYRLLGKDGRVVWIRDHAELLQDGDGRPVTQGIAHDITNVRLSEEAERVRRVEEEANRARNELLSRVSHELRTPLNAILGFGQLLQTSDLSPDDLESADRVVAAGHHLLGLVDEILEISQVGTLELSAESVELGDLVPEALALAQPGARGRGVEVSAIGPRPFPVLADPEGLRRALCRLVDHLVLDEPEGGSVTTSWTIDDGMGRIRIAGSGPGIPTDELASLFSPFNRRSADPGGTHAGPGTDLASAKHLIEAMGGTVEAVADADSRIGFEVGLRIPTP
jgi:PAS domain S-box-containing protein